jgi:hypothetical protein
MFVSLVLLHGLKNVNYTEVSRNMEEQLWNGKKALVTYITPMPIYSTLSDENK